MPGAGTCAWAVFNMAPAPNAAAAIVAMTSILVLILMFPLFEAIRTERKRETGRASQLLADSGSPA